MVRWQMKGELEKSWKKAIMDQIEVQSRHLPVETEQNNENLSHDSLHLCSTKLEDYI
jgi:hypothetical protein